jgi:hypothetical protein
MLNFKEAWLEILWKAMGATGKGYKREPMTEVGKPRPAGTKIAREAKAGMITKRNGRHL